MINTVKIQGDNFLVNGNMSVPNAEGNTDYQAVQEWITEGNTPELEFTKKELKAIKTQENKEKALSYLKETDWYTARLIETGKEIPKAILKKREKARSKIK